MEGIVNLEHIDAEAKGVWCFDFAGTDGPECKDTTAKSDVDGAVLQEYMSWATLSSPDGTKELCFSKVLQDLPAPLVPEEESFTSLVLSQEGKASDTADLEGDWGLLGAGSCSGRPRSSSSLPSLSPPRSSPTPLWESLAEVRHWRALETDYRRQSLYLT